jgi:hypothetical protein
MPQQGQNAAAEAAGAWGEPGNRIPPYAAARKYRVMLVDPEKYDEWSDE